VISGGYWIGADRTPERASVGLVCTVVTRWTPGEPLEILAVRDEFVTRPFDEPDQWWPSAPGVVGGRDQQAGGSWCVTDVATGVTALVLNRRERRTGTPSRGVLPLAAVSAGADWPERIDHRDMAAFNLVLAGPDGVSTWSWDATRLQRADLEPGLHVFTSSGVDTDDAKTAAFAPRFATQEWREVLASVRPSSESAALVVHHETPDGLYATVFAQLLTVRPGRLTIRHTRTPTRPESWVEQTWPAGNG
jgi:uncharacterized protein with NRDE domain